MYSIVSSNSEAKASELLETIEEMFHKARLKSLIIMYITHLHRFKMIGNTRNLINYGNAYHNTIWCCMHLSVVLHKYMFLVNIF